MDNQLAYDRPIVEDFNRLSSEHKKVIEWVGHGKQVFEAACHTGYISAWLQKNGCIVTGAELFEPALEKARPFLKSAILGDLESEEVWAQISRDQYDVVLYMHILEHLVNPEKVLERTRDILKPGGSVIICLPNVSNWSDRWKMFRGHFEYTDVGVMDKTHLKFYNYFTAPKMIESCGFTVKEYCGDSWKVRFNILPETNRFFSRINDHFNRVMHYFLSPNMTDRVGMYLITKS
ncbi:methyltransferase domain-containing protein [Rurimicrobium arvi]|uniref:Class I SAM-dependent methyltransferase n=1 Tax=Rurimicrobium arvi TaxID=2049916 RepID=A0ABP8MPG5_9BACT